MTGMEPDWRRVVGELGPPLYRYFSGSFAAAQASDLVQDTLIRLVQKCRDGHWSESRGTMQSYAFGIARLVRLEALKKKPRDSAIDENEPSAETRADASDRVAHLRWAIRQLGPIEQEILLRLIDEECGLEQIAFDLDIPLGTVKSHVHRAKEKLRTLMETRT